jgi:hypothetical protein
MRRMNNAVRVPENINQAILRAVVAAAGWVAFDHVCNAVLPAGSWRKRAAISARLAQLVDARKLQRRGEPRAYEYHATKTSLLDLRKVTANATPRNTKALARAATRGTRAAPTPRPKAAQIVRGTPKPKAHQHIVITPAPAPITQPPKAARERESVEAFLARGGRIQRLRNGDVSKPLTHIGLAAKQKAPCRARDPATDPDPE